MGKDGNEVKPILQVKNISKEFPGVKALTDVSIDFYSGEAHALVGENGAGKSTLVKIISGVYIRTDGEVFYEGKKRDFKNPGQALDVGISVIHQELSIANDLTVAENIFLGVEPRVGGQGPMLDRRKMNKEAQAVLDQMGVDIKATDVAGKLTAAHQQMIEIAKVITKKSKFVIMDEPTSSLSDNEIDALFHQIKLLIENNVSIIYISHRLNELQIVCERVTVLRDGQVVKSMKMSDTSEAEIVTNMVGREMKDYYNKKEHKPQGEMLRVEGLTIDGVFEDISFKAYKGEILGIAGLVGAKRTDVLESIFGAIKDGFSSVMIDGSMLPLEENIALTKRVVDTAHIFCVDVEAELGRVGFAVQSDQENLDLYTSADVVAEFCEKTNVDSVAIAIGSAHGVYKEEPKLDLERLKEINAATDTPLVLHGGSGIPNDQLAVAFKNGINKFNVGTEFFQLYYDSIAEYCKDNGVDGNVFDLPKYVQEKLMAYLRVKMQISKF